MRAGSESIAALKFAEWSLQAFSGHRGQAAQRWRASRLQGRRCPVTSSRPHVPDARGNALRLPQNSFARRRMSAEKDRRDEERFAARCASSI